MSDDLDHRFESRTFELTKQLIYSQLLIPRYWGPASKQYIDPWSCEGQDFTHMVSLTSELSISLMKSIEHRFQILLVSLIVTSWPLLRIDPSTWSEMQFSISYPKHEEWTWALRHLWPTMLTQLTLLSWCDWDVARHSADNSQWVYCSGHDKGLRSRPRPCKHRADLWPSHL